MSDESNANIAEFVSITGASVGTAQKYLANNENRVDQLLQEYFEESVNGGDRPEQAISANAELPFRTATTLPKAPLVNKNPKKRTIRTFQDLINGVKSDDSEGNDDDDDTNLFTGGEKSALQVENPNKPHRDPASLVQDILKKATDPNNGRPEDSVDGQLGGAKFSGTGFKLGDSQTPSTAIPDRSSVLKKPERVERKITFWKDGFSIGEGRLYRYDDPRNGAYLRDLNSGRLPLELLDVKLGQDVDVNVDKRLDEEYKPPKRKLGGFVGSGHRLGSPVPGESAAEVPLPLLEQVSPLEKPLPSQSVAGEGDLKLQIRLADGSRLIQRFQSSDPVQVVYDFVQQHTSDASRLFFLSLPFPVKLLDDKTLSIKDAGLVNAAVIQRWA